MRLSDLIGSYALDDFKDLVDSAGMKSPTARFYLLSLPSQPEVVVKVFITTDAERLFWQELVALYALRHTERVSPVLSDAIRDHPDFWTTNFTGPFFIAKPYYLQTLDSLLGTASPIEKLDLAAQRVEIARGFLDAGWRDYDWHPSNDVVNEEGKVLRIDLDSVLGQRPLPIKSRLSEPDYFSRGEREALDMLLKERKLFFERSVRLEVSNMAVRFCSFFFDENEQRQLADELQRLQPPTVAKESLPGAGPEISPSIQGKKPSKDHGFQRYFSWLWRLVAFFAGPTQERKVTPSDVSVTAPTTVPQIEPWLALWRRQLPANLRESSEEAFWQLTTAEWELLARLSHHLIAVPDHRFSLLDLYSSLLMLEAIILKDRRRRAQDAGNLETASINSLAPHIKFYELLHSPLATKGIQTEANDVEPPQISPASKDQPQVAAPLKISIESDGLAWPALGKDQSEDSVLLLKGNNNQFALVTDGASDASGRDAANIVVEEFQFWCDGRALYTPKEATSELRSLLRRINTKLIEASKTSGRTHQAMAAIAVVGPSDKDCFVAYAQAGDSQCVIFQPDGSIRNWTKRWTTSRLGQYESLPEDAIRAEYVVLNEADAGRGNHQVRLYSDGVTVQGFERIRTLPEIKTLVKEASGWGDVHDLAIGSDDWSVVGFDIRVDKIPTATTISRRSSSSSLTQDSFEVESAEAVLGKVLDNLNREHLTLSEACVSFWRTALSEIENPGSSVELLASFLGGKTSASKVADKNAEGVNDASPVISTPKEPWYLNQYVTLATILIALMGGVWLLSSIIRMPNEEGALNEGSRPDASPGIRVESQDTQLRFATETENRIYEALRDGKPHVEERLPGGEGIEGKIRAFLKELAQVLKTTGYSVAIDVYGDFTGSAMGNRTRTSNRAKAILRSLQRDYGVPSTQLDPNGRGLMEVATLASLRLELGRAVDTSGAVIVVRRRSR